MSKIFATALKDSIENIFESIFVRRDLEPQDFVEFHIGEGKVTFTRDKEDKNLAYMRIYDGPWGIEHDAPLVIAVVFLNEIQSAAELMDFIKDEIEETIAYLELALDELEK